MSGRAAYSVAQLAERWGCSEGHLYGLIRAHELNAFKIGQLLRIRAEEVERIECASSNIVESGTLPDEPMAKHGGDPWVPPTVPSRNGG